MLSLSSLCQLALRVPLRLDATQLVLASGAARDPIALARPIIHPLFVERASDLVAAYAGWSLDELDRYLRDADEPLTPPDDALLARLERHVEGRALVVRELDVLPAELCTPALTDCYARVKRVNERWRRLIELRTPEIVLQGEARTMARAVLELFGTLRAVCGHGAGGDAFARALYDLDATAGRGESIAGPLPETLGRARAVLRALGFEQRLLARREAGGAGDEHAAENRSKPRRGSSPLGSARTFSP